MLKTSPYSATIGVTVLVIALMILFILLVQQGEDRVLVQILVGVTLLTGFSYGAVERVRGMHPALRPGETLLGSRMARLMDGLFGIDGLLTLTSERVIFSPLWPGPVVEMTRTDTIRAHALGQTSLWVGARQDEYTFEIHCAPEWAAQLRSLPIAR